MARLSESDKAAFRKCPVWGDPDEIRSPRLVELTLKARARYIRWATEAAKFYRGSKPVRFTGEHWKL